MNKLLQPLFEGLNIGSGSSNYSILSISDELIILSTDKGSNRYIPTQLILDLVIALNSNKIKLDDILARKVEDRHIVEYLSLNYDKYIFGYERNIHDLCQYCIENIEVNQDYSLLTFFQNISEDSHLQFNDKLITRFISSLLTKPFVILTGLSGSGKTKLAQAFAMWICENESQYKIVPVGADWTNREPLLGYPNALKERAYVKPESGALDLILQATKTPEKPFFLILDEMNLSHVERYFADFLSAMESGEEVLLHSGEDNWDDVPAKISLPKNLFIVGTVNIDETTYMFSPKVLDRASVIEFRVTVEEMKNYLGNYKPLNMEALRAQGAAMGTSFVKIATDKSIATTAAKETTDKLLMFFGELKKNGAEFGYRSASEILRFAEIAKLIEPGWPDDEILDAAIMQKLLPKLHGSRNKLTKILPVLGGFCLEKSDKIKENYFDNQDTIQFETDPNIRYRISFEKICRMYKNAIENGYANYTEA